MLFSPHRTRQSKTRRTEFPCPNVGSQKGPVPQALTGVYDQTPTSTHTLEGMDSGNAPLLGVV